MSFVAYPTAVTWYRAHNASIVSAYIDHRDLADSESRAERFFLNVVLLRVLYAQALVAAPRLAVGCLAPLGPFLGGRRPWVTGIFLSLSRVLPEPYPLEASALLEFIRDGSPIYACPIADREVSHPARRTPAVRAIERVCRREGTSRRLCRRTFHWLEEGHGDRSSCSSSVLGYLGRLSQNDVIPDNVAFAADQLTGSDLQSSGPQLHVGDIHLAQVAEPVRVSGRACAGAPDDEPVSGPEIAHACRARDARSSPRCRDHQDRLLLAATRQSTFESPVHPDTDPGLHARPSVLQPAHPSPPGWITLASRAARRSSRAGSARASASALSRWRSRASPARRSRCALTSSQ